MIWENTREKGIFALYCMILLDFTLKHVITVDFSKFVCKSLLLHTFKLKYVLTCVI